MKTLNKTTESVDKIFGKTTEEEIRNILTNLENKLPMENLSTPGLQEIYNATLFYLQKGRAMTIRELEYPKDKALLAYLRDNRFSWPYYIRKGYGINDIFMAGYKKSNYKLEWYYYMRSQLPLLMTNSLNVGTICIPPTINGPFAEVEKVELSEEKIPNDKLERITWLIGIAMVLIMILIFIIGSR